MTERDKIIDRLVAREAITPVEAELLRTKEYVFIEKQQVPIPTPFPAIGRGMRSTTDPWINAEMERRMRHVENCGCNPKNGGSGVCGCTLGSPFVTCSTVQSMTGISPIE